MSPTLEEALSEIEKGAEERFEVLRGRKKQVEEGETLAETVPKLIGHVEKVEQEEFKEQSEGDRPVEVSGSLMADREAAAAREICGEQATGENIEQVDEKVKPTDKGEMAKHMDKDEMAEPTDKDDKATGSVRREPRSTPSICRIKDERRRAKIKEQE